MNRPVDQNMTPNNRMNVMPVRPAYIKASRKLEVPNILGSRTQAVSHTPNGVNRRYHSPLVEFRTQPADMSFDYVGMRIEMQVPYVLKQHGAGHHLIGVLHQVLEQTELSRR